MRSTMQEGPLLISGILRHGQFVYKESEVVTAEPDGYRSATFAQVGERAERLAAALRRRAEHGGVADTRARRFDIHRRDAPEEATQGDEVRDTHSERDEHRRGRLSTPRASERRWAPRLHGRRTRAQGFGHQLVCGGHTSTVGSLFAPIRTTALASPPCAQDSASPRPFTRGPHVSAGTRRRRHRCRCSS